MISPKSEIQNGVTQYSGVELGLYVILLTLYMLYIKEFITEVDALLKSIVVKLEQSLFDGKSSTAELLSPSKDIFVNVFPEEKLSD